MSPKYVLTYFNIQALAEPIRFLFAYGNIDYQDVRVNGAEEFKPIKAAMPLGQIPVLDIDGKRMHQHIPISRYVARLVGLAGTNAFEDLQIDIAVDTINDFRQKIATVHYETDENVKTKLRATLVAETIPFYLEKLGAMVKENNGYFALGKLTWADVFFAGIINYLNFMATFNLLEKSETLKVLVDKVNGTKGICDWINTRPISNR